MEGKFKQWTKKHPVLTIVYSVFIILFGIFLLMGFALKSGSKNIDSSSNNKVKDLSMDACYMAHQFAEERLKSPSTADFQNCYDAKIIKENNEYTVYSYVDSQNSFGAMIRTEYIATLKPSDLKEDYWNLINLYFND